MHEIESREFIFRKQFDVRVCVRARVCVCVYRLTTSFFVDWHDITANIHFDSIHIIIRIDFWLIITLLLTVVYRTKYFSGKWL